MTERNPIPSWPGTDERSAVKEMIRNRNSKHWDQCRRFLQRRVYIKAKNIPEHLQEEVVQEVMYKVAKSLPGFRFECALKTWLTLIIERCIADTHRKQQKERQHYVSLDDPLDEGDREGESFTPSQARSPEDIVIRKEDFRNAGEALLKYADTHANPFRNRLIIRMVLYEGCTHAEAAIEAGCSPAVVGYVIREAQRYVREKMGHRS